MLVGSLLYVVALLISVLYLFCRVVSLCMSPINDSFMSGSVDHSVRLWDLRVNACQVGLFFLQYLCSYISFYDQLKEYHS